MVGPPDSSPVAGSDQSVDQHNHEGKGQGPQGADPQEEDEVHPDAMEGKTWDTSTQNASTYCQVLFEMDDLTKKNMTKAQNGYLSHTL